MTFTTSFNTYCFVIMPKCLKNIGLSFTRMTKVVLGPQLNKNILAYVDDIMVTSKEKIPYSRLV